MICFGAEFFMTVGMLWIIGFINYKMKKEENYFWGQLSEDSPSNEWDFLLNCLTEIIFILYFSLSMSTVIYNLQNVGVMQKGDISISGYINLAITVYLGLLAVIGFIKKFDKNTYVFYGIDEILKLCQIYKRLVEMLSEMAFIILCVIFQMFLSSLGMNSFINYFFVVLASSFLCVFLFRFLTIIFSLLLIIFSSTYERKFLRLIYRNLMYKNFHEKKNKIERTASIEDMQSNVDYLYKNYSSKRRPKIKVIEFDSFLKSDTKIGKKVQKKVSIFWIMMCIFWVLIFTSLGVKECNVKEGCVLIIVAILTVSISRNVRQALTKILYSNKGYMIGLEKGTKYIADFQLISGKYIKWIWSIKCICAYYIAAYNAGMADDFWICVEKENENNDQLISVILAGIECFCTKQEKIEYTHLKGEVEEVDWQICKAVLKDIFFYEGMEVVEKQFSKYRGMVEKNKK